jgi:acetate kinase
LTPADVADGLEHHSGLVGLAGTGDMREVLAAAAAGVDGATLALEVYGHRLRAGIAAMAAALGGVDAITFTGGIGEHAARVRGDALAGLAFLGVAVDTEANEGGAGDRLISPSGAAVAVAVVEAREDLSIAADVRRLLGA